MDNSLQALKDICKEIGENLALPIDETNGPEILRKINDLTALLGTSSHAVALSQLLYSQKVQELTESGKWSGMTATDKKMIFAGRAKQEGYYVNLTERQNAALVHAIDGLRSILSYLKSEMQHIQQ